jgi:uncharacterized protein (TIGR03085 family)
MTTDRATPDDAARYLASTLVRRERSALAASLRAVGPDAPTLCEGWTAGDLARHLVLRERRPLTRMRDEHALDAVAFDTVVDEFDVPPTLPNPLASEAVDVLVNTSEFLVHHEDVRRAAEDWEPRDLSAEDQVETLTALRRMAPMLGRGLTVGVVLVSPQGGVRMHRATDAGSVIVRGAPLELLLFANGRRDHAQVEISGDDRALAALGTADLSI